MMTKDKKGFTVVELMVVIAIITVLAAIAVSNWNEFNTERRLNGAARQVMSDLMSARMKAISENRKVQVFFSGNQYTVCDDANGDGSVSSGEGTVLTRDIQNIYTGVSITRATANPIFNKNGTAAALASIDVSNASGTKTVSVAITGRVLIQ